LGGLYEIGRADLAARFGEALLTRFDQILDREDEPISPVQPPPEFQVGEAFPEPLTNLAAMEAVLARLLERMCQTLSREGRGARRLVFSGFGADGRVVDIAAGASRPGREPRVWARLFHEKLPFLNRDVGYDFMQLSALATAPMAAGQADWQGKAPDMAALSPLIDRLGNRFGFDKLQRQEVTASWWPERAVTRRPVFDRATSLSWPTERPRPLRLLSPPISVNATAPVPDDPPLFFRWRGHVHRIRAADGPERLLPEWWHQDGKTRDYYRVEDEAGQRFWLYREGLYRPDASPRWFLHGIFS
jgi:protein ImuB